MMRKKVFQVFLVICALVFALLAYLANQKDYFYFDLLITRSIQQFNLFWFDLLMKAISLLGEIYVALFTIITGSLYLFRLNKKAAKTLLFSSTGAILLSEVFKIIVSRPRPDVTRGNDSFPSGHVLFFIGFYGFLLFLIYTRFKNSLFQKVILLFLLFLLVLVGISRIYLGVHWASDVLGSYLIGTLYLTLVVYIYNKRS